MEESIRWTCTHLLLTFSNVCLRRSDRSRQSSWHDCRLHSLMPVLSKTQASTVRKYNFTVNEQRSLTKQIHNNKSKHVSFMAVWRSSGGNSKAGRGQGLLERSSRRVVAWRRKVRQRLQASKNSSGKPFFSPVQVPTCKYI